MHEPTIFGGYEIPRDAQVVAILAAANRDPDFQVCAYAGLPNPGMEYDPERTALVTTDPQNDFLSEKGVTWGVVGKSVVKNNTVKNIERLFKAAKKNNLPVFVSPHYYYPTDHNWQFEGALEKLMHNIKMFDRKDALSIDGFENSGADCLQQYKPYIQDGKTVASFGSPPIFVKNHSHFRRAA